MHPLLLWIFGVMYGRGSNPTSRKKSAEALERRGLDLSDAIRLRKEGGEKGLPFAVRPTP
jgi:hypothetical protein